MRGRRWAAAILAVFLACSNLTGAVAAREEELGAIDISRQEREVIAQMEAAYRAARQQAWEEFQARTNNLSPDSKAWYNAWRIWETEDRRLHNQLVNNSLRLQAYFRELWQAETSGSSVEAVDLDTFVLPFLESLDAAEPLDGDLREIEAQLGESAPDCQGPGNWGFELWRPSTWRICDGIDWYKPFPETQAIFGEELLADLETMGLAEQWVPYLNRLVALHQGEVPRTTKEAAILTINQVMLDIMLAEALALVPGVAPTRPQPRLGQPPPPPEPGTWVQVQERMSSRALRYQVRVGGRQGQAYVVNGVKFDGYRNGRLIEAKGYYETFVSRRTGRFYDWFRGQKSLVQQAVNQVRAAGDTPIEWHFREQRVLEATRELLQTEARDMVHRIRFVHTPMP